MTVDEFKAWFAGFCEGFETSGSYKTVPTEQQWQMIKDKVSELENTQPYVPVTNTTPFPIYYETDDSR